MGSSRWSDDFYSDKKAWHDRTNTPVFAYSADTSKKPVHDRKAHDKMDPKVVKLRESRDSDAHPDSLAIGVVFDVTGSMGSIPVTLQKKLPQLMSLLVRKGYVKDPQILFGAVGDFFADRVPLQIGQFESGNEMDDDLGRLYLEGGGGGSLQESYQNALYFFAKKTSIDCYDKRGRRGYLFLIGDEMPYDFSTVKELADIFGDKPQDVAATPALIAEVRERYNVFFIIPTGASHGHDPKIRQRWVELLGEENVFSLEDPGAVCEAIATAIGIAEGTVDLDRVRTDLADAGVAAGAVHAVAKALEPLSKTALAKVGSGNLPERAPDTGAARI